MIRYFLAILYFACVPIAVRAGTVDLGIDADSISFSGELVAGRTVRIYAEVVNHGETDVSGYVSFHQGNVSIGDSQVISVRTDGAPEEIFVDFLVPHGAFNIRAEIRGTDPDDENSDNDVAITKLFEPREEVIEEEEVVEEEEGDGGDAEGATQKDGVEEGAEKNEANAVALETEKTTTAIGEKSSKDTSSNTAVQTNAALVTYEQPTERTTKSSDSSDPFAPSVSSTPSLSNLSFSPNAIFQHSRVSWNTFAFKAVTPVSEGERVEWDFGDGVTSSRAETEHTYATPGTYPVTYRVTDANGGVSEDTAFVRVRFWTLDNAFVDLALGGLALLFLLGLLAIARLSRRARVPSVAEPSKTLTDAAREDLAMDRQTQTKVHVREEE